MNWGVTGILVIFGAFVLLLIFNPNLSCFGKRLKSPFYPLFRGKKTRRAQNAKQVKTEDYGFHLEDAGTPRVRTQKTPTEKKTDHYGFKPD